MDHKKYVRKRSSVIFIVHRPNPQLKASSRPAAMRACGSAAASRAAARPCQANGAHGRELVGRGPCWAGWTTSSQLNGQGLPSRNLSTDAQIFYSSDEGQRSVNLSTVPEARLMRKACCTSSAVNEYVGGRKNEEYEHLHINPTREMQTSSKWRIN